MSETGSLAFDLPNGPIRPVKMGDEVARQLRDLFFAGRLRPGQRLRLQELAGGLGVSTTPVREALLILEREGLVESEQRRGFRVARLTEHDILDVYELHAFVASALVERATPNLTDDDLRTLAGLDEQIRRAVAKRQANDVENLNFEFHRLINRRADDSTLLRRFLRETTRLVPRRVYQEIPGWLAASAHDHGGILKALNERDARAAAVSTADHIRSAGRLLVQHLHDTGVW
jgi:DNA-binding GntR family transcriptional regulator